ncbi:hypothetical protein SFRURICE_003811, partial [Spodoptera frugiperda]
MTSTLKCNNCNLVVDEMLSYVQNKLSIIDEDSLTKICLSTFTSAQIEKSKSLLFESLPSDQRKPARKGQGKDNRVLNDIISVFKVTDPDVMPVFVARDLEKLPPITFDHLDVSKLLKDILLLQSEVKEIKSSYATVSQLEDLKKDLKFTSVAASPRNVNVRGESRRDSASLLLSPTTGSRTAECYVNLDSSVGSVRDSGNIVISSDDNKNQSEGSRCCVDGLNKNLLPISPRCDTGERPVVIAANESSLITDKQLGDSKRVKHKQSFADTVRQQSNFENEMKKQNNEWTLVQSRKQRFKERFMGKMGKNVVNSDEKFRAADRKVPIFITNVHKNTSEEDIANYILKKTAINVTLEKINLKKQNDYNAFKFFVLHHNVQMFLNNEIWPQGIIFRRFVTFRSKSVNRRSSGFNVKRSIDNIRDLCQCVDVIALQETWLLSHEISYLNSISDDFN